MLIATSMYLSYFNLTEAPFSIAPNPRYLYLSQRHQEALAHLLYGVNGDGGFVLLTGEVGAGKTTVCRCLLEQVPESCDVAYIFNPKLSVAELLSTICVEFGIAYPPENTSIKVFVDCINTYLLDAHAKGRHTVLIIDEAQNLSAEVLEMMRLLTNLETNQRKLLQIILLGQPELAEMLDRPELRQLAQRIVARYHLGPLSKAEVAAYVQHRLGVSGVQRQIFPATLMGRLYRLSSGVPRIINVLCDRALLGAYTQGKEKVDHATLKQAAREVLHQAPPKRISILRPLLVGLFLVACAALAMTVLQPVLWSDPTATLHEQHLAPHDTPAATVQPKSAERNPEVKPPAPVLSTLSWPANDSRERSKDLAYAALFRAWGADYGQAEVCQQARSLSLSCRSGRGGLDALRQLNRPVVLTMSDDQGQEFYATMMALDEKSATYVVGSETRVVAHSDLAAHWSGRYTALLRLPPESNEQIRAGKSGPAVQWLNQQLAQAQGRKPPTAPQDQIFDEVLVRQVKQFQLEQGLVPDGAAGPQTLTRLSSVADQTGPKLWREK
ncbi:MAG: AAA family ATPase [Sterolibacterium sp.]|nr:AAA family ATPase [Sterolibacterium sp.]